MKFMVAFSIAILCSPALFAGQVCGVNITSRQIQHSTGYSMDFVIRNESLEAADNGYRVKFRQCDKDGFRALVVTYPDGQFYKYARLFPIDSF